MTLFCRDVSRISKRTISLTFEGFRETPLRLKKIGFVLLGWISNPPYLVFFSPVSTLALAYFCSFENGLSILVPFGKVKSTHLALQVTLGNQLSVSCEFILTSGSTFAHK